VLLPNDQDNPAQQARIAALLQELQQLMHPETSRIRRSVAIVRLRFGLETHSATRLQTSLPLRKSQRNMGVTHSPSLMAEKYSG
jgi:hypothetical protein